MFARSSRVGKTEEGREKELVNRKKVSIVDPTVCKYVNMSDV